VRNVVDSRRHLIGLFMPLAVLVLVAMVAPVPGLSYYAAPGTVVILLIMILEGVFLARTVTKKVRAKFPDATDKSLSLGWYSFVRGSQIRKLRIPKPVVQPGAMVD
jgi:predicted membrane metal-binding protein